MLGLLRSARPLRPLRPLLGRRGLSAGGTPSGPSEKKEAVEQESGEKESGEREKDEMIQDSTAVPRMSMAEIQALHARKAAAPLDPQQRAKISTGKVFRGSDWFLDFEEVPAPWKGREGPYKPIYLLSDANWVLRKSKNADRILGGFSVAFVCCSWGVYTWAPHLML